VISDIILLITDLIRGSNKFDSIKIRVLLRQRFSNLQNIDWLLSENKMFLFCDKEVISCDLS